MVFYFIFVVSLSLKIKVTVKSESTVHSCLFFFPGPCKTARYLMCQTFGTPGWNCAIFETVFTFPPKTGRKLIPIAELWQTEQALCSLLTKVCVQYKTCLGMFYFIIGRNTHFILVSFCSVLKRTSVIWMYITCTDTEVLSHEGRVFSTMVA